MWILQHYAQLVQHLKLALLQQLMQTCVVLDSLDKVSAKLQTMFVYLQIYMVNNFLLILRFSVCSATSLQVYLIEWHALQILLALLVGNAVQNMSVIWDLAPRLQRLQQVKSFVLLKMNGESKPGEQTIHLRQSSELQDGKPELQPLNVPLIPLIL